MLQLSFVNFKPNSYLIVEGNTVNDRFYIIQKGNVTCFHEYSIPGIENKELGPGDFVGVIPSMSGHSQIENVIAKTDVVAIMVKKEQYPDLIVKNTPIAMKIIRSFTREMRILNGELSKLTVNSVGDESSEQLFSVAEYYFKNEMYDIAAYGYYQYLKACPQGANLEEAKKKFLALRKRAHPVYLEETEDMIREYPVGTMIFSDCQFGGDMFIIQEGSVKICKVIDGSEITFSILKKGDMFGEMALLENKPRSASAIAHSPCKLMVVNRKNFEQMVATQPQMISRLTIMLADRLWSMYRQLANTQLHDLLTRMTDMLALQVEKQHIAILKGQPYSTNLTAVDLMNLCSISPFEQPKASLALEKNRNIKMVSGKIVIKDLQELIKQADFYKKQEKKREGLAGNGVL